MTALEIELRPEAVGQDVDVVSAVLYVDGREIGHDLGGIGTYPHLLLDEARAALPARLHIRTCGCGEPGCWSLAARVQVVGDEIVWDDWREGVEDVDGWPSDPVALPEVRFDAGAYANAIERFRGHWDQG